MRTATIRSATSARASSWSASRAKGRSKAWPRSPTGGIRREARKAPTGGKLVRHFCACRWPEYQIPRLGKKVAGAETQIEADLGIVAPAAQRPKWPADGLEQIRQVREVLAKAPAPMPVEGIAIAFDGRLTDKRRERIRQVLAALVTTRAARTAGAAYFVPR